MSVFKGCIVFILCIILNICLSQKRTNVSLIIKDDGGYTMSFGELNNNADVIGYFVDSMETTGWGILEIRTNVVSHDTYTVTDEQLMYYAGFIEGYLTSLRIYETFMNTCDSVGNYCDGPNTDLQNYIDTQSKYQENMYKNNKNNPIWIYANLLTQQLNGLYAGYNVTAAKNGAKPFDNIFPILFLNIIGDLFDIPYSYDQSYRDLHDYRNYQFPRDLQKFQGILAQIGHCSALVKITPEIDNIFVGHSSWFTYENMNRIFKHYIFNLNMKTATKFMSFSSYPGYLESLDDYYLMDSGLVMLQVYFDIYIDDRIFYIYLYMIYFRPQIVCLMLIYINILHQIHYMHGKE